MNRSIGRILVLGAGILLVGALYVVTLVPSLTGAVQMESDAECTPVKPECGCGKFKDEKGKCTKPGNKFMCPCKDVTSGHVTPGVCMAEFKCKGEASGGMPPMPPMPPMMPKMPKEPMQQNCPPTNPSATTTDATSDAASTSPQKAGGSDPNCNSGFGDFGSYEPFDYSAYFNVGSSSEADSSLFDSLNSKGGGISEFLASTTKAAKATQASPIVPTTTKLLSDLFGDIRVGGGGATIIANLKEGATEIAGFFGGNTFGAIASQSIAGRLCAVRPWAGGMLARIIPASFFDGLCRLSGYQVGVITPSGGGSSVPTLKPKSKSQTGSMLRRPNVKGEPTADIWAEPPEVRLGTRTYIFWKSSGVLDCKISGPNFSHNSFQGGASTVPLSGASTFTIECTAPNGTKVSDMVTVKLAI